MTITIVTIIIIIIIIIIFNYYNLNDIFFTSYKYTFMQKGGHSNLNWKIT